MQIHREIAAQRTIDRCGNCTAATLTYIVTDTDAGDHSDAALALTRSTSPLAIGSAVRKEIVLSAIRPGGIYEINACYASPATSDERRAGDRSWSFEIATKSSTATEAKALIQQTAPTGSYPPHPGLLIGWDGRFDGNSDIAGTKKLLPEISEICVATYHAGKMTSSFRRRLTECAGKMNLHAFHGWNPGEVLLLKVSQSSSYQNRSGDDLVDVTYRFGIRRGGSRECGGLTLTGTVGWNVVWNISRRDPANNRTITAGTYESRIYDYANFALLDI